MSFRLWGIRICVFVNRGNNKHNLVYIICLFKYRVAWCVSRRAPTSGLHLKHIKIQLSSADLLWDVCQEGCVFTIVTGRNVNVDVVTACRNWKIYIVGS